jgi:Ser/Thr protein kinase RdoA (MazF antagonist)
VAVKDMIEEPANTRLEGLYAEAVGVLERYGRTGATVELLSLSENATFEIDDPLHGKAALRLHRHGYVTREQIASALAWSDALRKDGVIATPRAIPALNGDTVVTMRAALLPDERNAVLFEWAPGSPPDAARLPELAPRLGELAAHMHEHSSSWTRPPAFVRHVWTTEQIVGRHARWGTWQAFPGIDDDSRELLDRAVVTTTTHLHSLESDPSRFGLVHADIRLGNVLACGDELTLIDFDDCGFSWYLWDLIAAFRAIPIPPDRDAIIASWLDGYRTVRPIAVDKSELLAMLLLSRLQGLGWLANRLDADAARELGAERIQTTCELANEYLQIAAGPARDL